jgi:hypothetical protein
MSIIISRHGAEHGDLVSKFRRQGHQFPNVQSWSSRWYGLEFPANFGGRIGLGIPSFVLRGAAEHEQDDASFGFAAGNEKQDSIIVRLNNINKETQASSLNYYFY